MNYFKLTKDIIEVNLSDSNGLTLAEDIYADVNIPAFNNSSMDGYAINYSGDQKRLEHYRRNISGKF